MTRKDIGLEWFFCSFATVNTEGITPQYPAANTLLNLYRNLKKRIAKIESVFGTASLTFGTILMCHHAH
jgi:hypothetical protein